MGPLGTTCRYRLGEVYQARHGPVSSAPYADVDAWYTAADNIGMLTCYAHTCRLPRGDLTYAAFRLGVVANLEELRLIHDFHEDIGEDELMAFLDAVPILAPMDLLMQIDLLGRVWAKQRQREPLEADLLDAAVVYAACQCAAQAFAHGPGVAKLYLDQGPRKVRIRIREETGSRFEALYEEFWDDYDFLLLGEWQDMPPAQAAMLKQCMRVPDESPLYEALARGRISPGLRSNLRSLLTPQEIDDCVRFARLRGLTGADVSA